MYGLKEVLSDIGERVRGGYECLQDSLFPRYESGLAAVGAYTETFPTGIYLMTRVKGRTKLGTPGTSKRVAKGVILPGYDSSSGGLKEFLGANYRLTPTELSRVMNDFRGGRKDRAMKFLSSRRKESAA